MSRMKLGDLQPNPGSKRSRKRVGRGHGSGMGKTAGRGTKGQGSRSGDGGTRPGFEGGQTPLQMRTPKLRGPYSRRSRNTGIFRRDHAIVNVGQLDTLRARLDAETEITLDVLVAHNLCRRGRDGLRVLGSGKLTGPVTIHARHFSAAAREKIEAAGGQAILLGGADGQSDGDSDSGEQADNA